MLRLLRLLIDLFGALLCLQNQTDGSPPEGGGFFNQHYGDFCISRDRPKDLTKVQQTVHTDGRAFFR
jgi:hypothetical protein